MKDKKQNKAIGIATVGPKGQIVIPISIRELFDINPGDNLVLLADTKKGIAIVKESVWTSFADQTINGNGK